MSSTVINFPKMFNIKTFRIDTLDSNNNIDYYTVSIKMLLKTTLGSFDGDVNYGSKDIILDINNSTTLELYRNIIADTLRNNIPELANIKNDDIKIRSNNGTNVLLEINNNVNVNQKNLTFNLNELLK